MASPLLSILAALVLSAPSGGLEARPPAHPNSLSESRIEIRRDRVVLTSVLQVLSLAEVIPELDPDLDGRAAPGALEAHAAAIADYVAAHYRIAVDPEPGGASGFDESYPDAPIESPRWSFLTPEGRGRVREAPPGKEALLDVSQYVLVDLHYVAPSPPHSVGVEVDLFARTSPDHQDVGVLLWNGLELEVFDLGANGRRVLVATPDALSRNRPSFGRLLVGSAREAPRSWDAALLALLIACAAASRGRAIGDVLMLAAAASAGVLGGAELVAWIPGNRGPRFLELAAPLAVGYVGADLLLTGVGRRRLFEAAVFGVVLGARDAVRWSTELARESPRLPAQVGLALGAAALVLAVGLPAIALRRPRPDASGRARRLRILAAASLALGLVSFARHALP